jgi:hypothetical protein
MACCCSFNCSQLSRRRSARAAIFFYQLKVCFLVDLKLKEEKIVFLGAAIFSSSFIAKV